MYHRFEKEGEFRPRHLPASIFAEQLDYISNHHLVWNPDRQLEALDNPSLLQGGPPVVITIDDGYRDFIEVAYPLLEERAIPATLFVTTGFIDERLWFWWDRLAFLLANAEKGISTLKFLDRSISFDPSDMRDVDRVWNTVADHLSVQPDHLKEEAISALASACGVNLPQAPPEDYAGLNWDQIQSLAKAGIVIGAHTTSHPVLSRVNADRARQEIRDSGKEVAKHLGQPTSWFCYPQGGRGDYLPETVRFVGEAGYRGSYVAHTDAGHDGAVHSLPRYSVSRDRIRFQWILCGAEYLTARWALKFQNPKDSRPK